MKGASHTVLPVVSKALIVSGTVVSALDPQALGGLADAAMRELLQEGEAANTQTS